MPSSGRPSQVSSSPCCTTIRSLFGLRPSARSWWYIAPVVIAADQVERGEDAVHVAVVVVERERDLQLLGDALERGVAVLAPAVDPGLAEHAALPGMGMGVVGVERDRALEQALRLGVVLRVERWCSTLPASTHS